MQLRRIREALSRLGGRTGPVPAAAAGPHRPPSARFREFTEGRRAEFRARGYNQARPFFPHRTYYIPKAAPDGLRVAGWMCGVRDADRLWELVVHAHGPVLDEFPADLFFDHELLWHRQHLGRPGQVAYASLALKGRDLYALNYVSDLVQRIGLRRELKTRVENRFKGWPHVLLNSTLCFALERGIARVWSPTATAVLRHTDPARTVGRELFERVYDRAVHTAFRASRRGDWWVVDAEENRDRVVLPDPGVEALPDGKTICVCHDVEGGLGHLDVDPAFAAAADRTAPAALAGMLRIERALGVRATYNVLGCLVPEVRGAIEPDGHCLAFHSYDHQLRGRQLARCREVDYRVEGYRPPRSRLTWELSDRNLCLHNFQWLAVGAAVLRTAAPRVEHRVVKIPIAFDDYELHRNGMSFAEWERRALEVIARRDFVAFALHDCYAPYWLPQYGEFLRKIAGLGCLRTLDEVAHATLLAGCA